MSKKALGSYFFGLTLQQCCSGTCFGNQLLHCHCSVTVKRSSQVAKKLFD